MYTCKVFFTAPAISTYQYCFIDAVGKAMPKLEPEAVASDASDVTLTDTCDVTPTEPCSSGRPSPHQLQHSRPHLPHTPTTNSSFQTGHNHSRTHTRTCPARLQTDAAGERVTGAPPKQRSLSTSEIQNWKRILARKATKYDLQLIEHNHRRLPIMRIRMRRDAHDDADAPHARSKRLQRSGSGGSDDSTGDASRTPEKEDAGDATDTSESHSASTSRAHDDDVTVRGSEKTRIKIRLRLGRELAVVRDVQAVSDAT